MHLAYLGPVSCVFTCWVSSELTIRSDCSLMAARWQYSFLSEFPQGSPAHHLWQLQSLMTVTCLFTEFAGSNPFLTGLACVSTSYTSMLCQYHLKIINVINLKKKKKDTQRKWKQSHNLSEINDCIKTVTSGSFELPQ